MNEISKQLKKIAERSNGKMKVVNVPEDRIPDFGSLVKLDNEILAQVGERNTAYNNIIRDDITSGEVTLRLSGLKQEFYTKKQVSMEYDELINFLRNAMNYGEMQIWIMKQQVNGIEPTLNDMLKKFFELKTNEDIIKLYDIEQNYNENNLNNVKKLIRTK